MLGSLLAFRSNVIAISIESPVVLGTFDIQLTNNGGLFDIVLS